MNKWISVEDKLPVKNTIILTFSKREGISICIFHYNNDEGIFILTPSIDSLVIKLTSVTHWMQLPKSPLEEFEQHQVCVNPMENSK